MGKMLMLTQWRRCGVHAPAQHEAKRNLGTPQCHRAATSPRFNWAHRCIGDSVFPALRRRKYAPTTPTLQFRFDRPLKRDGDPVKIQKISVPRLALNLDRVGV